MASGHGNIPEEVIESVLARHDIVDTVGKVVHLSKQGKYLWGLCPFHSEKTPSFTVTPTGEYFIALAAVWVEMPSNLGWKSKD